MNIAYRQRESVKAVKLFDKLFKRSSDEPSVFNQSAPGALDLVGQLYVDASGFKRIPEEKSVQSPMDT